MALTGSEVVEIIGVDGAGRLSGESQRVTTATISGVPLSNRGTVTVNGTTAVSVAFPAMTATTVIVFSLKSAAGTQGATPTVRSVTAGTGFTVEATASDTSTYNWAAL